MSDKNQISTNKINIFGNSKKKLYLNIFQLHNFVVFDQFPSILFSTLV